MAENTEELQLKYVIAPARGYDENGYVDALFAGFYTIEDIPQNAYQELWLELRRVLAENERLQKDFKAAGYVDKKAAKRGFWWWDIRNWTAEE